MPKPEEQGKKLDASSSLQTGKGRRQKKIGPIHLVKRNSRSAPVFRFCHALLAA